MQPFYPWEKRCIGIRKEVAYFQCFKLVITTHNAYLVDLVRNTRMEPGPSCHVSKPAVINHVYYVCHGNVGGRLVHEGVDQ